MDEIYIPVVIKGEDQASPSIRSVSDQLSRVSREVRHLTHPLRRISMDVWSLAYSIRRLGTALGISSPILEAFYNTLVVTGAVLRMLMVISELANMINRFKNITSVATLIQALFNVQLSQTAMWVAIITGGLAVVGGLIAWTMATRMGGASTPRAPSMQYGGLVPQTGLYMLHRGETVIPEGPSYSWVDINMTTGPISTEVDVDNMLDSMGLRIAEESRRRRGR